MSGLFDRIKKHPAIQMGDPKKPSAGPLRAILDRDAVMKTFEDAWVEKAWATREKVAAQALAAANPVPRMPTERMVNEAHAVLHKLIEQSDSIICDPKDLAARAWAIEDAMVAEYQKRCT